MSEKIADLEAVKGAINELRAESKPQTVRNIREKVGGGSFDTLRPLIKQALAEEIAVSVDDENRFKPIIEASASVLRAIVQERTAGYTETIGRLEADLDEASKTIAQQKNENTGLTEKIGNLEREINELKALVVTREKDTTEARERLRGAEKEAANYMGQNEQLNRQMDVINKQLKEMLSKEPSTKVETNESGHQKPVASANKKTQKSG
jgi:septal ring factor EnvC (AmiA/AmiB activator)